MSILYTVFTPLSPLSRTRWNYYQHEEGAITRTISGPGFESKPTPLEASSTFPGAIDWARCLHDGPHHFEHCPEAQEVYTTLANAARWFEKGEFDLARTCIDGIALNCQQWKQQIEERKAA